MNSYSVSALHFSPSTGSTLIHSHVTVFLILFFIFILKTSNKYFPVCYNKTLLSPSQVELTSMLARMIENLE